MSFMKGNSKILKFILFFYFKSTETLSFDTKNGKSVRITFVTVCNILDHNEKILLN